jgi:sugar-specific transcriptional regulator TrmB
MMLPKKVTEELAGFDLAEKEINVYLYLTQKGASSAGEIAKGLRANRTETYKVLKALENKGIIEATIDYPIRFSAVSIEKALKILVNIQKERVKDIEARRAALLDVLKQEKIEAPVVEEEKTQIIKGIDQIYASLAARLEEGAQTLRMVIPEEDLIKEYLTGMLDLLKNFSKKLDSRLATNLKDSNHKAMKELQKLNIDYYTVDMEELPYFMTIDNEVLILTKPPGGVPRKDVTAFWTNNRSIVNTFKAFFEDMWTKKEGPVAEEAPEQMDFEKKRKEEVEKAMKMYTSLKSLKEKRV